MKYCSFCGRNEKEVSTLVVGNDVCICDGCVFLCVDTINHHESSPGAREWASWFPIAPTTLGQMEQSNSAEGVTA